MDAFVQWFHSLNFFIGLLLFIGWVLFSSNIASKINFGAVLLTIIGNFYLWYLLSL